MYANYSNLVQFGIISQFLINASLAIPISDEDAKSFLRVKRWALEHGGKESEECYSAFKNDLNMIQKLSKMTKSHQ